MTATLQIQITKHLRLMPIDLSYREQIFNSFTSDVIKFLPLDAPPKKIKETEHFIQHAIKQRESGEDLVWVILCGPQFLGCCGVHSISSKTPHFGIWIKTEEQGKGYGSKILDAVVHWSFENLELDYIRYPVDKRNKTSLKLIHKWGLQPYRTYEMGNTKKLDILEYRIPNTTS